MQFQVSHKERFYFFVMVSLSILLYGALLAVALLRPVFFGSVLWYGFLFWAMRFVASLFFRGWIQGSGVKVSAQQFPEVFAVLKAQAQQLEMKEIPDMYLMQSGGVLNAFAVRLARRNFIVVYSEIFDAAYQEGLSAVSFIIGHELAHLKRKHTSYLKHLLILPASIIPFLGAAYSRACEYTADNIGYHLCPEGAVRGLLILSAGKHLYKRVNVDALLTSFKHEAGFATWLTEIFSSHPLTVKRVAVIDKLDRDTTRSTQSAFVSPIMNLKNKERQL